MSDDKTAISEEKSTATDKPVVKTPVAATPKAVVEKTSPEVAEKLVQEETASAKPAKKFEGK